MFKKFFEFGPIIWITLAAIVLIGAVMIVWARRNRKLITPRMLAMGAMCIALSFILSYIRLYKMPQGGSVTPASMLPMLIFSYAFGFGPGLIASLAYGMLQFLQDPYFVHPLQLLLDYPLAFGAIALGATARYIKNDIVALPLAALLAGLVRVAFHTLSGVVFFAEYAEGTGLSPLAYSLSYNLSSVGVDALICVVIIAIPQVRNMVSRVSGTLKAA